MQAAGWAGLAFLLHLPVPANAASVPPLDHPEAEIIESATVVVDGVELFQVSGTPALPAADRARRIALRIGKGAKDPRIPLEALATVVTGEGAEINFGRQPIMVVTHNDAKVSGLEMDLAPRLYSTRVGEAIGAFRKDRTPPVLARGAGLALLTVALAGLALFLLRYLVRRIQAYFGQRLGARIRLLRQRAFPTIDTERFFGGVRRAVAAVHFVLALLVGAVALEIILGLFPWSRGASHSLLSSIIDPLQTIGLAAIDYLPKLIFLLVLALVTRWAIRLLKLFFEGVGAGRIVFEGFDSDWAPPTYRIARLAVLAFAVVVAYPYLPGSDSAAFKGVTLFLGVMISLGSTSAIANMIAGYSLTYRRAFKIGDVIRIGDNLGAVTEIRLLVTHLMTKKNEEVVIPNSVILNSHVVNFSSLARREGLILHTTVGIGYEVPWRQVEAMLLQAARRTPGLRPDPPPFVHQKALGDFAVTYELNAYTEDPWAMAGAYSDLHRNIQDAFNEHGVQIMTPAYESDPERPKIVSRENWFAPPAEPPEPPPGGLGEGR